MALFLGFGSRRSLVDVSKCGKPAIQFSRNRSFIQKKLVSRDECLKMSRTSGADFQSILGKMNLIEQWPEFQGTAADVQVLRSSCSALGHSYIRPANSFPACHRIGLVMQRIDYMSKMGLTAKEKRCAIKQNPPLLLLAKEQFCDSSQMVYLRGVLREGSILRYLFYPVFPRTQAKKTVLDNRLNEAAERLATTREQILDIAMSLPCVSISRNAFDTWKDSILLLHLKTLPKGFDMDVHSLDIYPPICSKSMQNLRATLSGTQNQDPFLVGVKFTDLLDTRYSTCNGQGCAEDLTEFLLRSHLEELQYLPPVNFKKKKIPRKQRRFSDFSAFKSLMYS